MPLVRRLSLVVALAGSALAGLACAGEEKPAAVGQAPVGIGHVFIDSASGVAIDLPADWRGRYRAISGITDPVEGLRNEVALRFVRADSSVAADSSLIIARIFDAAAWRRIEGDSLLTRRFGGAASKDDERALVLTLRLSTGNPFQPGTADALGYDTLMIGLFSRPMRAGIGKPMRDTTATP